METQEKIQQLRSLALFQDLSDARFEELTRFLRMERVPAGSMVMEEGSAADAMYLVAEGQVRIEKAAQVGEARELAILAPGEVFGEAALIEESPRWVRAVALVDTTLFVLCRADLCQWLQADALMAAGFFVALLRVVSHRLRRSAEDRVLLHELSRLAAERIPDAEMLLQQALTRLLPHFGAGWSGAAYLAGAYCEEAVRVAAAGPDAGELPAMRPITAPADRLRDERTFCVALARQDEPPLGFLVLRGPRVMAEQERTEIAVSLAAIADLLCSALHNLRHDEEERLRARLEQRRQYEAAV